MVFTTGHLELYLWCELFGVQCYIKVIDLYFQFYSFFVKNFNVINPIPTDYLFFGGKK